jgi:hypothetical protein
MRWREIRKRAASVSVETITRAIQFILAPMVMRW